MDEVELKANDNTIKFVIEKRKWCRIYFVKHNTIIKLGADALDIIIPKLVHAINTDAERKYFLYKEMKIFTILCLMEPHTVIVGRNTHDSKLQLLYIEDGGNIIPIVTLSKEDIQRWTKQLTNLLTIIQ